MGPGHRHIQLWHSTWHGYHLGGEVSVPISVPFSKIETENNIILPSVLCFSIFWKVEGKVMAMTLCWKMLTPKRNAYICLWFLSTEKRIYIYIYISFILAIADCIKILYCCIIFCWILLLNAWNVDLFVAWIRIWDHIWWYTCVWQMFVCPNL